MLKKLTNPKRVLLWFDKMTSKSSHKARFIGEYTKSAKTYDKESKKIKKLVDEMMQNYDRYTIEHGKDSLYPISSGMNIKKLTFLYDTIKKLKPDICVETGVANGFSTAVMLLALKENKKGKLYSIDICFKPTGVIIPKGLVGRWVLIEGMIKPKLTELLRKLKKVDFFLHDGSHTYRDMLNDYTTSWTKLPKNGILVSDDVNYNDAFLDFSNSNNQKHKIFKMEEKLMGVIKKSDEISKN